MVEWFGGLSGGVQAAAVCLFSYAMGCVSCAYYLTRALRPGEDIRTLGSGNAGATNVGRILGRQAFMVVMLLDGVKGLFAALIAQYLHQPSLVIGLAVFFCVAGHVFPAQLGFRGGKGIAPATGGILAATPVLWLAVFAIWLFFLLLLRKVRLSTLLATLALPPACILLDQPMAYLLCYLLIAALLAVRSWAGARNEKSAAQKKSAAAAAQAPEATAGKQDG